MTIDIIYFTPEVRCYRDGHIERLFKKKGWVVCKLKPNKDGYLRIRIDKKMYYVNRLMGFCFLGLDLDDPLLTIDHINHNKTDNRVSELRIATHQQQQWNKKESKGYYWHKQNKKWMAYIGVDGKLIYLGCFAKEEDARSAYLAAKERYHVF